MKDIISGFIDNELSLSEKIGLVTRIREDADFSIEVLQLLDQEKLLRSEVFDHPPVFHRLPAGFWRQTAARIVRPRFLATAAVAALIAVILLWPVHRPAPVYQPHRFVLYRPNASRVEIAGSFTKWRRIPLVRAGKKGYWEVTIALPVGEHRFSYIVEGRERIPDPTVLLKEGDDFGGSNSVLRVEARV